MAHAWNGRVEIDIRDSEPDWGPFLQPTAPPGAPNVLMIVWDDVGYGALEPYGGPIETPTMRRIAEDGVRYSNFHTTALCSPTRSSLLNGRNATSNNMACITEGAAGFPGFSARIPFENGLISEVLDAQGWNTYAIGKWHLTPSDESDASSWKGRWPLGRGFQRFYGFMGGETHQWYPDLVYDNHTVEAPATPEEGYHLSADLADKAIRFVRDAKSVAPQKPWFMYFCPGCAHAPHHVFKEWADRYKGKFDEGYEAIRSTILANQKQMGLLADDVELSPINPHGEPDLTSPDGKPWPALDFVRPWDSLNEEERRLFARMAEVYAGFVSYTDDQIGRFIAYLEESEQLENTIIVVVSDNGSSGEGGPNGSFNENKFFNNIPDTIEANLARIDDLGSPSAYNHYNTGWAWAFDTPFPYWKRFAGYEGGVADPLIVSWPAGIPARGEVRDQYVHAVDIVPTLYEFLGVTPPDVLNGWTQAPIEGQSFASSIGDPKAKGRETQFYSMLGMRALYHRGWLATAMHPPISGWEISKRTSGSSTTYGPIAPRSTTSRTTILSCSRNSRDCGSTTPVYTKAYRSTTGRRARSWLRHDRSPVSRGRAMSTTRIAPTYRRRSPSTFAAAPTPSPQPSPSTPQRRKGCCSRTAASRAATACSSGTVVCTTSTTGWVSASIQ
jgi:arylsulfatase A-like enzyme